MSSLSPRRILKVMVRPTALQWLRYTYGGKLRPINRGWVLRDVTCRTRWLRQAVRAVVQVAPPAAVVSIVLSRMGFSLVALGGVACGALAGGVVLPGLHRPECRAAPREAWLRAGKSEAN